MTFSGQFTAFAEKVADWLGERTKWGVREDTSHKETVSEGFTHYPLSRLLPYEAYDEKNAIFINQGSLGFILEASVLTGATEETETILASVLTDVIPAAADLQIVLWASDKIDEVLSHFERARSGQGQMFEWLARKRTDFLRQGTLKSLSISSSLLLRDFKLLLVVSLPKKHIDEQIVELIEVRQALQSSLKSIRLFTRDIPITVFMSVLWDLLNPSNYCGPAQRSWNPWDTLSVQLTDPEYRLQVFPNRLLLESETEQWDVRSFSVSQFPREMTQWRMTEAIGQLFNDALQIPCPFVISLNLRLLDHEKSIALAQMKYMNKDSTAKSPLAKFKPAANREYEDWHSVRQRLAEGDRLVKVFYQVVLYAHPYDAPSGERKLRDLYRANGWKLHKQSYLQLQSWLAMLPMMMTEGLYDDLKILGRLRTLTAFNAVTIAPLQGEWKGTTHASLLLPGRRGQIATWNPFDNLEGNYNVAIAAASGRGKSVLTQEYIVSIVGSGGRVWVIDVGRSYEKTCRLLGGEFIEFTPDHLISINPFTFITQFNESLELLKPLTASMIRPSSSASDEEVAYLEKALKAAWQMKGNEATFTDVAHWLSAEADSVCKNLAHLLYPYTVDGMYGRYFEGHCTIHLDNPFVVLELEELKAKKDLQKIMLLVLMYQISERMYLGNRHQMKSCIIDEAWDLLSGENAGAAQFIETGYRRARRYNANFVTITQSINDYFKNATSIAAYENSDNNLILGQKPEALDQLKESKRLSLDPFTEKLFKSLKKTDDYSECIIKSPTGLSIHRILLDPYARILYSSKGEEFEAVKELQAQGLSLQEAIAQVARRLQHV
jgi:conjugal transfer ATP-binding protein TraC